MGVKGGVGRREAMYIPKPAHWISPEWTGKRGHGAPKRDIISVPPVMEPRFIVDGKEL